MKALNRALLLTFTLLLVFSCRTDDAIPQLPSSPSLVNYVTPGDIPNVMRKLRHSIQLDAGENFTANTGASSSVGTIGFDEILQVLDTLNNANYTFKVNDRDDNPMTFTNLIVREWVDGAVQTPYLMKYEMDSAFFFDYVLGKRTFEEFEGKIWTESIQDLQDNEGYSAIVGGEYTSNDDLSPCNQYTVTGGSSNPNSGLPESSDAPDADFDYDSTDGTSCSISRIVYVPYECPSNSTAKYREEGLCFRPVVYWSCVTVAQNGIQMDDPCPDPDGNTGILTDITILDLIKALDIPDHYFEGGDCCGIGKLLWYGGLVDPIVGGFIDGIVETIETAYKGIKVGDALKNTHNLTPDQEKLLADVYMTFYQIQEILRDPEKRKEVWDTIKDEVATWVDETVSLSGEGQYNIGKVAFDVATMFIGIGEVKSIIKTGNFTVSAIKVSQKLPRGLKHVIAKAEDLGHTVVKTSNGISIRKGNTEVMKISNGKVTLRYSGYGRDIKADLDKTTTLVGKFKDPTDGQGIHKIKETGLYNYGENKGGFNILDDTEWTLEKNLEWLNEAISRNDIIRVVSDPRNNNHIWVDGIVNGRRTPFGEEVKLLIENGYKFDPLSATFKK